jgi:hypothetical protein
MHARNLSAREPGDLRGAHRDGAMGRVGKAMRREPTMNGPEKSDGLTVPTKSPNDAGVLAKEAAEGKSPTKGNTEEQNAPRTQSRIGAPSALDRVREAARKDRKKQFTALLLWRRLWTDPFSAATWIHPPGTVAAGS